MNCQKLRDKLKTAIDLREQGKLDNSRVLFEKIIEETEAILKKDGTKEAKYLYLEVMGEYVIQIRLEAQKKLMEALELGRSLLSFDKRNNINHPLSIRSVSNTLINLEKFEEAIPYLKKLIKLYRDSSAQAGDTRGHLARCLLRIGKLSEAKKAIDKSIEEIEKNSAKIDDTSAWFSHALMVKALVLNAESKKREALSFAKKALRIAEKGKKAFRIDQAKTLIEQLNQVD